MSLEDGSSCSDSQPHFHAELSIALLRYTGFLPVRGGGQWARRAHAAWGYVNVAACGVLLLLNLLKLLERGVDLLTATSALCVAAAGADGLLKGCWVLTKGAQLLAMERRLRAPLALPRARAAQGAPPRALSPQQADAVRGANRLASLLARAFLASCASVLLAWDALPYVYNRATGDLRYQRTTIHFSDVTRFPGYDLEYLLHAATSTATMAVVISIDCFAYCVLVFISLEFKLLNAELEALGHEEGEGHDAGEDELHIDPARDARLLRQLRRCVQRHCDIIRFSKEVEAVFSTILMAQFLVCACIICLNAFQITLMLEDPKSVLKFLAYTPVVLADLFIFCWFGEEIQQQSVRVARACFGSRWFCAGVPVRRALRLVMTRAQRPVVFTAGRIYDMSLDTFVNLIRASYSMCALLFTINEEKDPEEVP